MIAGYILPIDLNAHMKKKLETHQREYCIVSITAVLDEVFSKKFTEYFAGAHITEMAEIMQDGVYYWASKTGEFDSLVRGFMKNVEHGQIDLACECKWYNKEVKKYEKLILMPSNKFSLNVFLEFQEYYRSLFKIVFSASYAADFINDLSNEKRQNAEKYITKMRLRGERIHKDGEKKFIPRYLKWLAKNHFKEYEADDLKYLLPRELVNYIHQGEDIPSRNVLRKRKKLFVYYQNFKNEIKILTGKDAREFIASNDLLKIESYRGVKDLRGQIAQAGVVAGRVRIILSTRDLKNFKKGEIIVSQMTDPSYLPAMKKAKAFITDEGGVLCHAAIVARELKKPCIIATKIATKVLHDGDMVEVDANKGMVKIIK